MRKWHTSAGTLLLTAVFYAAASAEPAEVFLWPTPQEVQRVQGSLTVDESVPILLPSVASEADRFLATRLAAELADWYGLALSVQRVDRLPASGPYILLGSTGNELVKEYLRRAGLQETVTNLPAEGYLLRIDSAAVVVAGVDQEGAFHGLQTLRQLLWTLDEGREVPCVTIRDWPALPFRGIRLYVAGRDNLAFFKRFLADFAALFKYNRIIMEMNAALRFDRHPELNAGWREFAADLHYTRRSRPEGPHGEFQDSAHHDAGDGGVLEKRELKEIVEWARLHHLEIIPEVPSLTHSYYLLTRHRELAEVPDAEWPDTYCPSNPGSYRLLFDVLDEILEVIQPTMIHIGHDEWRMDVSACPRCRDKDHGELFAQDVRKIYDYLRSRGVRVALWGDHLLESVRGRGYRERKTRTGYEYKIPGGLRPEQVRELIPKDILVFNWFWGDPRNDTLVQEFGFQQAYGNLRPDIAGWEKRRKLTGLVGGAPSSWAATTEFNIGKDLLYDFLGCIELLWNGRQPGRASLARIVRRLVPRVRLYLQGQRPPSQERNPVQPLDLSAVTGAGPLIESLGLDLSTLKSGEVSCGAIQFQLPQEGRVIAVTTFPDSTPSLPVQTAAIEVGQDASSLIFLHACARPATNEKAYRMIYNFDDTAELLGWYEVTYEDGYTISVPIRYGVNVLEWDVARRDREKTWPQGRTGSPQGYYAYLADPVECSTDPDARSITFFAYEWRNPRFGKRIETVRLRAAQGFRDYRGRRTRANAVLWAALSLVLPRDPSLVRATSFGE